MAVPIVLVVTTLLANNASLLTLSLEIRLAGGLVGKRRVNSNCARMAPVWLTTSTGTLNCGAAVVGGEVGRQRDS